MEEKKNNTKITSQKKINLQTQASHKNPTNLLTQNDSKIETVMKPS